jgi:hypothetical protein
MLCSLSRLPQKALYLKRTDKSATQRVADNKLKKSVAAKDSRRYADAEGYYTLRVTATCLCSNSSETSNTLRGPRGEPASKAQRLVF